MMRTFILLFLLLSFTHGHTQTKNVWSLADSARFNARITGIVKQFFRWTDRLGDNYLLLTVTNAIKSPAKLSTNGQDCRNGCTDKELYAYHFITKDSLLWKLADFEKDCNFDNIVEFRKNATRVTDLDNNGLAEIWIMYSTTCTNDAGPRTLKLIMYQGNKKYAIRGTSQPSKSAADAKAGGKFNPDKEFESLPRVFKDYAKDLWMKFLFDTP